MVSAHKEQKFWTWFQQNEDRIFHFERDQDRVFNDLAQALGQVSTDLTFEFGPVENDMREFVISAGGMKKSFPHVEALANTAPEMPRWSIIKYRPRRSPLMDMTINGVTVKPEDIDCALMSNGRELGIRLFFDGYTDEHQQMWAMFGYLFLDQALGEFDVETKLGMIAFAPKSAKGDAMTYPLPKLPELFDMHVAKLSQLH